MAGSFGSVPYAGRAYDEGPSRITDLILRAGDIQAQRASESGQIWGNTVAGLGQQAAGVIQEMQARKEEQRAQTARSNAIDKLFSSPEPPDPRDIIRVFGPKEGADVIKALGALNPQAKQSYSDKMEQARDTAKGILALPTDKRAQGYAFARGQLVKNGVFAEQEIPEQYDEGFIMQVGSYAAEAPKPISVSPGEGIYDPATQQTTVPIPAVEKPDTRSLDARYAEAVATGDQATAQQLLQAKARLEAAGRAPEGAGRPVQIETVDEQGRPVTRFVTPQAGQEFVKPSGQARPATGQQRKALSFFNRMSEADEIAMKLEEGGEVDPTKIKYTPDLANFMLDDTNQAYKQAQRAFTEARLRKESGATVKDSEYEQDAKTYFKQPGDSAATIEQKRRARQAVRAGIAFESGDALQEFYGPEAQGMIERLQQASKASPTGGVGPVQSVAGGGATVRGPQGKIYTFPSVEAAEEFRRRAGGQ